jgi:hypothetical protein
MKKLSFLILICGIHLIIQAQYRQISLPEALEIAQQNADALWGISQPAEPLIYYGNDDLPFAFMFNFSIGKSFPEQETLISQCREYAQAGDEYKQWGGDDYGRILIGARDNMPVILEYSQSLSQEYALGYKFLDKAAEKLGKGLILLKTYYISHAEHWQCYSNGKEEIYINLFPPSKVINKSEFQNLISGKSGLLFQDNYSTEWDSFQKGKVIDNKADIYIDHHEMCPYLDWSYGCSPTAAAMVLEWWDNNSINSDWDFSALAGYYFQRTDAIEGETDYNVSNLHKLLALGMDTDTTTGSTWNYNMEDGIQWATNTMLGYNINADWYWCCDEWTAMKNEINADRPLVINIPGHSVCGVGYNTSSNTMITHYTWDPPDHLVWVNKDEAEDLVKVLPGGERGKGMNLLFPLGDTNYNHNGSGETLLEGGVYEIKWSHEWSGSYHVRIYLSTTGNGGYEELVITDETNNDGSFEWVVPSGYVSTTCRLVLGLFDDLDNYMGADGTIGNFKIQPGGSIQSLTSETAVNTDQEPDYFQFNHTGSNWCVVGVRPHTLGDDWDIEMFTNNSFTEIAEGSYTAAENNVDFVVMDRHHVTSQNRGIKVKCDGEPDYGRVEYEGGTETLVIGNNNNIIWPVQDVAECWDVHLTPGNYRFTLHHDYADTDLNMALYSSTDGDYFKGKNLWKINSYTIGVGVDEQFTVNITSEDDYALVVWAEDDWGAQFDIIIENLIPGVWTGASSEWWHDSGNWTLSDIPDETIDVVIPAGVPHYPKTDYITCRCRDLTIEAGATVTSWLDTIRVYRDMVVRGSLILNNFDSRVVVADDVFWESGSTASVTSSGEILVGGDWIFKEGASVHIDNGYVGFTGSTNSKIEVKSNDCWFNHLGTEKPTGYFLYNENTSTQPLKLQGDLYIFGNSTFINYSFNPVIIKGDELWSGPGGRYLFPNGSCKIDGSVASISSDPDSYFNDLIISTTGTVQLLDPIEIRGDLLIESGVLDCNSETIVIKGDWTNNVGISGFWQETGTVEFYGTGIQYCNGEQFNVLNLNKSAGELRFLSGTTQCASYNWTSGAIRVNGGTFIADDLVDDGLFGDIYVSAGQLTYTQDATQFVDLNGYLNISGGTMTVWGGGDDSYWPYAGDATIIMSGGALEFRNVGINVVNSPTYTFGENIHGGTIRTTGRFTVLRTDFTPTGGTIELYGADDANLSHGTGSNFYNLTINKTSKDGEIYSLGEGVKSNSRDEGGGYKAEEGIITATTNLDLNGDLLISAGTLVAPSIIRIAGTWDNFEGTSGFTEGTGYVSFDGTADQYCSGETFNSMELSKSSGSLIFDNAPVTCGSYNWDSGAFTVNGADVIFNDLYDDGIYGTITVNSGLLEIHQGTTAEEYVDINGNLIINGGDVNVYGGADDSFWPYSANGSLTMTNGNLSFTDVGIYLYNSPTFTFTESISGGTIKTRMDFRGNRTDFTPSGGTLMLYGGLGCLLQMGTGSNIHHLEIDKSAISGKQNYPKESRIKDPEIKDDPKAGTVTLYSDFVVNGNTTIQNATIDFNNKILTCKGNVNVNNLGKLALDANAKLLMGGSKTLNVNSGGTFEILGVSGSPAYLSHVSGYYNANFESGSTINASNAVFEYMGYGGIYMKSGCAVTLPFDNCTFTNGNGQAGSCLLRIDNAQTLSMNNISFPTSSGSGTYNVMKTVNSGQVTFNTATGAFAGPAFESDPYNRIHWTGFTGFDVALTAFLEGPYIEPLMNTTLNSSGFLPLVQPYNEYPHFYTGTEGVAAIPSASVVDWVLIEVRDATSAALATPATTIGTAAGFILNNGTITSINGTSAIYFSGTVTHNLYAVVWHRNHLGIISANPLTLSSPGHYTYNFSSGPGQVYGGTSGHKKIGAGTYGMVAGNGYPDATINGTDKTSIWSVQAGKKGYREGDMDMNGQVNNKDKNEYWLPNYGYGCQVPGFTDN